MTVSPLPTSNLHIGFVSTRAERDGWSFAGGSKMERSHEAVGTSVLLLRRFVRPTGIGELRCSGSALCTPGNSSDLRSRFFPPRASSTFSREIRDIAELLKAQLYEFVKKFDIHLLVVENTLAIPLNLPFGVALTEFITKSEIHTIGHHHDLYWERNRFLINCVWDLLDMCFPPRLPASSTLP